MSLPHALLAALVERPCSGAELARRFDRSLGYFWHATHQQIYRELARMEAAGWIASLPEATTRGRMRAYRLLPAGRKVLRRWIATPKEPTVLRDETMVSLWAEAAVGPTAGLAAALRQRLQQHEAQLALYEQFEARDHPQPPATRSARLHHLVLGAGIAYERHWAQWLRQALQVLEEDGQDQACAPSQHSQHAHQRSDEEPVAGPTRPPGGSAI